MTQHHGGRVQTKTKELGLIRLWHVHIVTHD